MGAYRNEDDPSLLDAEMIRLLMRQNELLKERLKLEMQSSDMYRDELHRQKLIDNEEDRTPF